MNADSVFVIGQSHKVCDDYAVSSTGVGTSYAVISDGCSGSENTDTGSRVLTLTAADFIKEGWNISDQETIWGQTSEDLLIVWANNTIRRLGLEKSALDATLLGITSSNNEWSAFCSGDGFFAKVDTKNKLSIYEINMPSGYPLYLSYLLDDRRRKDVLSKGGNWNIYLDTFDLNENCFIERSIEERYGFRPAIFKSSDEGILENVLAVFSDGVASFIDEDRKPVPASTIIQELIAFKGFKGKFVQRRMQGFLRYVKKQGWTHQDDLSMAAIYLGPE